MLLAGHSCSRNNRSALLLGSKDLRVEIDIDKPLLVESSPELLKIVISNVFDNAVKYARPGSVVRLRCGRPDSSHVNIVVSDVGVGIEQDEIDKIFRRYYRGRKARLSDPMGTGIGLYLVRHVTEKIHGSVAVESRRLPDNEDWLSTVTITLPLHQ